MVLASGAGAPLRGRVFHGGGQVSEPSEHPTAPYGQPTLAQFRALVDEEVERRVRKIEYLRQEGLVIETVRLMGKGEQKDILEKLAKLFGAEAGL